MDHLTIDEAAAYLRVSRRTVYREVAAGRIRLLKIRGSSFIRKAECDRYAQARERRAA